ncbi:MAG: class I SAM-dependent methyltransferase [Armatimonadota bacterium]|jgi:SAM-dependent methyltransferase
MSWVEYYELPHLYDLINEEFIAYDLQATYVARLLREEAPACRRVLDLGCATGQHAARLASDGFIVTGIDLSPALLRQGRGRTGGLPVELLCADLRHLPLLTGSDAAVCLNHTINYMLGPDLGRVFREVHRILRPGGLFVFDFFDYGPTHFWVGAWRDSAVGDGVRVQMTHRQSVDAGGRVATDAHTYEVHQDKQVTTYTDEDVLRVTHTQEVLAELDACGFQVLKGGTKRELGLEPTSNSVAIVAQTP